MQNSLKRNNLPLTDIDVIILAGGLGSRLHEVLPDQQKVTAEIKGCPFIEHLIQQFVCAGARRIVLAAGHLSEQVRAVAERPRDDSIDIEVSIEPEPLGTAGAIVFALNKIRSKTVLVANGDSYVGLDVALLIAFHRRAHAALTLSLISMDDGGRYGTVEIDEGNRVTAFREKLPTKGRVNINAGVYVFEKVLIETFSKVVPLSLETDVLPLLIGQNVCALRQDARFIDIGTPASLDEATGFFDSLTES